MISKIFKKSRFLIGAAFFILHSSLFTSCSDVQLPASASNGVEKVSNLTADYQDGSREVTLRWTNPSSDQLSGIQIIKDDKDVTNIDEVVNSYYIKKAPTNVNVSYTVKARYQDGTLSEGQTVRFIVNYEAKKGGSMYAMLVPADYQTGSADEADAVAWFKQNYIDKGAGTLFTPANIDDLDIEQYASCWVMCDRIGLEKGWQNLPGLASNEVVNALKAFCADGGNLLLTNHATQLTVALGRIPEAYAPGIYGNGEGGQNNDIWGSQPVIGNAEGQIYDHSGHDIYRGMEFVSGLYERPIYCFEGAGIKGDHNCMWDLNAFGLTPNPNVVKTWEETTNSTVLGTWNHVMDYCCAGIVDFNPTTTFPGRILAVGLAAYEWNLGGTNEKQGQLERFTSNCLAYVNEPADEQVAMLVPADYQTGSADEADAVAWFKKTYVDKGKGVILTPATIDDLDIEKNPMCWVMCDRVGIDKGYQNLPGLATSEVINALKAYAADGGNLLLTNHATQLTVALGRIPEAYAPGIYGSGEGGQNNDIWGSQPVIGNAEGQIYDHSGHDIYWGMQFVSGLYERPIYCFEGAGIKGDHNCMWDLNAFGLTPNPNVVKTWEETTNSTVLGTWNHVMDYCCAGIVDFNPTTTFNARILAVGLAAYEWNIGGTNEKQDQLEKFTANCISYLK